MSHAAIRNALALAVCGALYAGSSHAALRLSDAFDGSYFRPGEGGRGALIDVTRLENGTVIAGMALYLFDGSGNPLWLTLATGLDEFQYSAEGVQVSRLSGGNFGNPFQAPTTGVVGTASFSFNSCTSVTVTLDMDEASGLPDTTYEWTPVVPLRNCVYTQAFEGCPAFAEAAPEFGDRACRISGDYLDQDITLGNETTWVMEGKVGIGADNANPSTLRIEPGTLIVGSGDSFDHIAVLRGSKIYAEGRVDAPIVMTSPFELPGVEGDPNPTDVGGLAVSGNAPANCNPNCVAEWDPSNRYGGDEAADSSGSIRYMQVRYSGYVFTTNRELNAFTFNGVGSGTTLENLQSYYGADDGVEFFGGTANLRKLVVTCPGDDAIDWDEGWSGKLQFALVEQRGCAGEDHGFESANSPTNFDATPRATPTVANVTLLGNPEASRSTDGFSLKEGTGGRFWNSIATGFTRSCIDIVNAETSTAAGAVDALTGTLTMNNTLIDCPTSFRDASGVPAGYTSAWFAAQSGNAEGALNLDGPFPTEASPVHGLVFNPGDDWFMVTDYAGAFRSNRADDNWTADWTHDRN